MSGRCWGKSIELVRLGEMEKTTNQPINARKTITSGRDAGGAVGTGRGERRGSNRFAGNSSESLMAQSIYFQV